MLCIYYYQIVRRPILRSEIYGQEWNERKTNLSSREIRLNNNNDTNIVNVIVLFFCFCFCSCSSYYYCYYYDQFITFIIIIMTTFFLFISLSCSVHFIPNLLFTYTFFDCFDTKVTCATDTRNVRVVFDACKDIILRENLKNSGFVE